MSNVPMTRREDLLAEHLTSDHHMAFLQLADGRILRAAGGEFIASEDGGMTWSEPFQRRDKNGNVVGGGGTSMVNLSGKGIGLAAIGGRTPPPPGETLAERAKRMEADRGTTHMLYWRSDDGGETWEPPVRVAPEGVRAHALHDVMIRTSSGRLVLPVYISMGKGTGPNDERPPRPGVLVDGQLEGVTGHWFDPHGPSVSSVYYSDDEGRIWRCNQDGEIVVLLDWNATFTYVNEPSVAEVAPGRLLLMMRNQMGRLYQAWSYDNAETWTRPQPTSLAASTTPGQIRSLRNGHLLLVWNQEGEEDIRRGLSRRRLSSAISRNGGSVWEFFQNVESIFEETRVEPGPICRYQPEEVYFEPGLPAPERDPAYIVPGIRKGIWSYPSVLAMEDRVLIGYGYATLHEHPTKAQITRSSQIEGGYRSKIKVLPMTWFYGGKEPADNPFLENPNAPNSP